MQRNKNKQETTRKDELFQQSRVRNEDVKQGESATLSTALSTVALSSPWTWTYMLNRGHIVKAAEYGENIITVGTCVSLEAFWVIYSCVKRPSQLEVGEDYHFFVSNIKPMWEDEANASGGRILIRVNQLVTDPLWELTLLATITNSFCLPQGQHICGVVASKRAQDNIIAIWLHRDMSVDDRNNLVQNVRKVLLLPSSLFVEYRAHTKSPGKAHKQ